MIAADPIPRLPALRSLGDLSDVRPVIVIDTREQTPLRFPRLQSVRGTLQSGDYALAGLEHLAVVERKSLDDLVGSVTRDFDRLRKADSQRPNVIPDGTT